MLVTIAISFIIGYAQANSFLDLKEGELKEKPADIRLNDKSLFHPIEEEDFFEANGLAPVVFPKDYQWNFTDDENPCLIPVNSAKCGECPYQNISVSGTVCYKDAEARTDYQECTWNLADCCNGNVTNIQSDPRTCHYNSIADWDDYMCYYPTFDTNICNRCPRGWTTAQYDTVVCDVGYDIQLCYHTLDECCGDSRIQDHDECLKTSYTPDTWHIRDCVELTSAKYSLTNFDCFQLCLDYIARGDTNVTLFKNIQAACPQTIAYGMHLVDYNVSFPVVVSKYFDQWSHGHPSLVDDGHFWNAKEIWATSPAMCQAECQTYDWCIKFHYVLYTDQHDLRHRYKPNACFLKDIDHIRGAYTTTTDEPFYNELWCPQGLLDECYFHPWNCTYCEQHYRCIWRDPYLVTGWVYSADYINPCLPPVGPLPKDDPFPL